MNYNPYTARFIELTSKISGNSEQIGKIERELAWFNSFHVGEANTTIATLTREVISLQGRLDSIEAKVKQQAVKVDGLRKEASPGFNPRNWFSAERAEKKKELEATRKDFSQLEAQQSDLRATVQSTRATLEQQQRDINRYREFDCLQAQATVAALRSQAEQWKAELAEIQPQKIRVDEQLKEPLEELQNLDRRKRELESQIKRAEYFEQSLNGAANSYERKMIHDSCSTELGDSKPARILSMNRRELESATRNIGKLEQRMRRIGSRAARVIKMIVIDGNNLCYEQKTFIGLSALLPVAQRLTASYTVVIVFDASIRRQLQMSDHDIAGQFGKTAKVHVVASKTKADETILDAAADPCSYVVSNDRFAEFPEKSAMRDQRLIRHEILNGNVYVHDLDISVAFTATDK